MEELGEVTKSTKGFLLEFKEEALKQKQRQDAEEHQNESNEHLKEKELWPTT